VAARPTAAVTAHLWRRGCCRIGEGRFCRRAVQVYLTGFGEDWNAGEHDRKQNRYHKAFHFGSS